MRRGVLPTTLGALVATPLALAAAGVAALWAVSPGTTSPIADASGRALPGSVAEALDLEVGGVPQFVLARGRDASDPVLLLLHGGPGDPDAAPSRAYNRALEDHFVVVHWDQRGAGRSYSNGLASESMTVDQLLSDTQELTGYLKRRFGKRRILLLGHSWGSYLGIRAAQRHPEDYHAYVGVGQVADQQRSEASSYEAVLRRARSLGRDDAVRELEAMGPPVRGRYRGGLRDFGRQRRWVREFGGAAHGLGNRQTLWLLARPILLFREYRLRDKLRYLRGESFSMAHLEEPMLDDPPARSVPELRVPVFFLLGRHDLQTVSEVTRDYFEALRAPRKELVVFEESAHLVPYEEAEAFQRVLIERVRPLALAPGR